MVKFKLPMKKNKVDEICDILITKYGILKRCDHPQNEDPYHLDRLYLLTEEVRNHGNRIELQKYGFLITAFNVSASLFTIIAAIKTMLPNFDITSWF
jgi:hypothetical protein